MPARDDLLHRELDWLANLHGFYEASGYAEWPIDAAERTGASAADRAEAVRATVTAIQGQVLTPTHKTAIVETAAAAMNPAAPLYSCAACGVRSLTAGPYTQFALSQLGCFRCTNATVARYQRLLADGQRVGVPNAARVMSVYSAADSTMYSLHPELIDPPAATLGSDVAGAGAAPASGPTACLCNTCSKHASGVTSKPPPYCLLNVDYGVLARAVPEASNMSPLMLLVLGLARPEGYVINVSKDGKAAISATSRGRQKVKGHLVTFEQDAVQQLTRALDVDAAAAAVQVVFLGSRAQYDRLRGSILSLPAMRMDVAVVLQCLSVLRVVRPDGYGGAGPDAAAEDAAALAAQLEALPQRIFNAGTVVANPAAERALNTATGDVARGRGAVGADAGADAGTPQPVARGRRRPACTAGSDIGGPPSSDSDAGGPRGGSIGGPPSSGADTPQQSSDSDAGGPEAVHMGVVHLTTPPRVSFTTDQLARMALHVANQALGEDVTASEASVGARTPGAHDAAPEVAVRRAAHQPINEFESNDRLHYSAYATIFPLGEGLQSHSTITLPQVQHILLQFHCAAAHHPYWKMHAYNQLTRHTILRTTAFRVRNNATQFAAFRRALETAAVADAIRIANDATASAEARKRANKLILRELQPFMLLCGQVCVCVCEHFTSCYCATAVFG
jgi:hypothetical protein